VPNPCLREGNDLAFFWPDEKVNVEDFSQKKLKTKMKVLKNPVFCAAQEELSRIKEG
jgi:hypothetical protein